MTASLNRLSASDAAHLIADGKITSEALVQACLDRIAEREDTVRAWAYVDPGRAVAQARRRDAEDRCGPLHGVPVGIKDIIDTYDMPTEYGSPIYAGHQPEWDAACVALVRAAGGVILGKTVTTELAADHPGKTAHPHNPAHTPGGSSSGSAAAVADHMVPLAFGTQTAGSVIRPASYCGIVGYKATHDQFNLAGIRAAAAQSLDCLGVLARSVADCALMRAVLVGAPAEPKRLASAPRVGLCRTRQWDQADAASRGAVEASARNLAKAGAHVADLDLPAAFNNLVDLHHQVMCFEMARSLAHEYATCRDRLSNRIRAGIELGRTVTYEDYVVALEVRDRCRQTLAELFNGFDVLLAPSAPGEAPAGLGATGDPLFSRMWTLLKLPNVALPGHTGPTGLPIGVQAIGAYGQDDRLLAVAAWMEKRIV